MLLTPDQVNPEIAASSQGTEQTAHSTTAYDEPFLARLRNRDPAAFDQLVLDQGPSVQHLVCRLLGWADGADDIVQDVFVIAWQRMGHFRGDAKLTTWLHAIAINCCRKQRRGLHAWKTAFDRMCESRRQADSQSLTHADQPDNTSVAQIHQAINLLPHRDRELIVLHSLESKSLEEISGLLGIKQNALNVRLHRARKRLKKLLAETQI